MRKFLIVVIIALVIAGGWFVFVRNDKPASNSGAASSHKKATFNKKQFSLEDSSSLWIIANKKRPLEPQDYKPSDLVAPDVPLRLSASYEEMQMRAEAATAIEQMFADARTAGLDLMVSSAFRSYSYQRTLYNGYVKSQGKAVADTQSARPGYSEHQTGWAVDIGATSHECQIEQCFGTMPEGQWAAANAYKYGFVIRYPRDKQATTGYIYEPWHLRYIGKALAQEIHNQGNPTLEEFFGLPAAPDYQ